MREPLCSVAGDTSGPDGRIEPGGHEAEPRDVLDTASWWTWETDSDGRLTSLSLAFETGDALDEHDVLGRRREELPVIAEHRDVLARDYTAAMAARMPIRNFTFGLQRADGGIDYTRLSGNPCFDAHGQFTGYRGTSTTVTALFEAARALEESHARFRDFADSAADWYWETDREHRYVDPTTFGGKAARFGTPAYVGKRRIDLPVVDADLKVLEDHMADLEARRPFRDMLYRMPNENGSIAWIKASGHPVFDRSGTFAGYRGSARDVTEDETRKFELRRALESMRDFAESASDWFWETGPDHRFRVFSASMDNHRDVSNLAAMGKSRLELDLHPDDVPSVLAHMAVLETRQPFRDLLYRVQGTDGNWLWIKAGGKPIFDAGGRFDGYRGSGSHVTDAMMRQERLAEEQAALRRAEEVAKIGHWRWRAESGALEWSESVYDLMGFHPDERVPDVRKLIGRIHPDDKGPFVAVLKDMENGLVTQDCYYRWQPEVGGQFRYFRLRVDLEYDRDGKFIGNFGILQDITEQKLAQLQLNERSQQLQEAQRIGRMGDWSYNIGEKELWWAPEIYELLRLDPTSFRPVHEQVMAMYIGDGSVRLLESQKTAVRTRAVQNVDVKVRRGDGTAADFVVTSKVIASRSGRAVGFTGTIQDITDRKHAEEQLEKLAYYDPLTGLANRALFRREIEEMISRTQRNRAASALLLLDLDRFKEVNDSLGHAAGDDLLTRAGHLIGRVIGASCSLYRLGGDEFAVVVPDCDDTEQATERAHEIIRVLSEPIHLDRGEVNIGASIGIVMIPRDGSTSEELMRHADLALYRAKEEGGSRLAFFDAGMSELVQQKTAMARDLRMAAQHALGLEARYQPQIDLATDLVVGFESLMRWKHPTKGYIPPSEFIPIAESSSLITEIGLWILRESTAQARLWLDLSEPPREISVNVSAAQIWQTELEHDVARILEETRLPPHLLCLELTESLFADHAEGRVRRALTSLKKLGVTLALDDFGTGYSSLGYLTQLPFDKLKIDRVFVDGIVNSRRKRKLLEGMVALGRGLGMTVIAEGAEMPEEVDILRSFNCDCVQGFVFARPCIAAEAITFAHGRDAAFGTEPARLAAQLRRIGEKI